jgi:hypothetical protein
MDLCVDGTQKLYPGWGRSLSNRSVNLTFPFFEEEYLDFAIPKEIVISEATRLGLLECITKLP